MSDLSLLQGRGVRADAHSSAGPQLPVHSYFDAAILQREQELIFQASPAYLGHRLAVPQLGDYLALVQENEGRALVHTASGVQLLSNVCRHRQALMLRGRGTTGSQIVCPLHRWTYKTTGELLGAPHFACNPALHLETCGIQEWNGLLFEDRSRNVAHDLAALSASSRSMLDFDGYVLDHVEHHVCNYNWKTFIEVYLEDYHVGPFHPGLGNFVTCDDLQWQFGQEFSVQTVGVADSFGKPGSQVYKLWHEVLLRYRNGALPERGAVWLTLYPTVMVEWYPHVLTISTLFPQGLDKTLNIVEFYYPEEICAFEREFVQAQRAAYMETCIEDDEIAERMDAGRQALYRRGRNEVGPYQQPMEAGMEHFHHWYRQRMQGAPSC